jgi:hypothetical protein
LRDVVVGKAAVGIAEVADAVLVHVKLGRVSIVSRTRCSAVGYYLPRGCKLR